MTRLLNRVSAVIDRLKEIFGVKNKTQLQREYTKSKHRCPICGKLVGCDSSGNVKFLGTKLFYKHLTLCRRINRVKAGRLRYEEER